MLNWRTGGPDHWASNPLQAPCLAVDSEQGRKTNDRGIFLQAMEWSPAKFHDIGNSAYVMEKVFLSACFCLSQQYYQANPRLVLLPQLVASSSINRILIQYCSDNPHGAVVLTESAFSTALTTCYQQYYQQNPRLVLLRQPPWSSSNEGIGIQYCSHNLSQAVLST